MRFVRTMQLPAIRSLYRASADCIWHTCSVAYMLLGGIGFWVLEAKQRTDAAVVEMERTDVIRARHVQDLFDYVAMMPLANISEQQLLE